MNGFSSHTVLLTPTRPLPSTPPTPLTLSPTPPPGILRSIILSALAPHRLATAPPAPGGGRSSIEGGGVLGATAEGEEGPLGSLTKNSSLQVG
jgi:hypothetical protein